MVAYWVAHAHINVPAEYKKYTDLVPEIIGRYGGKVLARGGRYETLEGSPRHAKRAINSTMRTRPKCIGVSDDSWSWTLRWTGEPMIRS